MEDFLKRQMTKSEMNVFQAQELQMDDEYKRTCGEAVDRIVQFLQRSVPWTVEKTVKGGSLGKGTAIRGSSDLDAIVFLGDFQNMDDFQSKIKPMIRELKTHLENTCYYKNGELTIDHPTPYASKFNLKIGSTWIPVDLLPAYDNISKTGKEQMYADMARCSDKEKQYYSSSLAQLQIDFVNRRPAAVKNLIRVAKHWRKTCIPESEAGKRFPSSYPLELICIGLWERKGRPETFDLRIAFKNVLQQLINYNSINVSWMENYQKAYVPQTPGKPYILDPANPYNNIADSINTWSEVARCAHSAMGQPLLSQLQGAGTCKWN